MGTHTDSALGGHSGSGKKGKKQAIGVPNDYSVPIGKDDNKHQAPTPYGQHAPTTKIVDQGPRYFEGDQWGPGSLPDEARDQLQRALIQAGLLDPKDYQPGVWDAASAAAYRDLLRESNGSGMGWKVNLQRRLDLAAQGLINIKGARKRAPLTVQLTSPTEIKARADDAAPELLGRKLTDSEVSPFVKAYNDQERLAQTAAYNAEPSGGTVTAPPQPKDYISQAIKDKYKTEVGGNQIGQNALVFMKLLGENAPTAGIPGTQL